MSLIENNSWEEGANSSPSFQLSHDEIHIWSASLESSESDVTKYLSLLSPDEKERAKRFYFKSDENRFITGRGKLRLLLSNYIGTEPAQIEFTYGQYGKPNLIDRLNIKNLQFNLSHSKDMAIYIFNWNQPIGVDIEHIRPMKDMDDFALQFFTPNEHKLIQSLSKDQKQESFFKIWTCKEAFLKANGSGLTMPINMFEVSNMDHSPTITSLGEDLDQTTLWRLKLFNPAAGYQSAMAVKGYERKVRFQNYEAKR